MANRQQILSERQYEADRRKGLLTTAAVSLEEKQTSDASAAEAQSDYDAACAQRDMAQLNLDRTTIRSPVNGYVTNLHLRVIGDYATPGKPITKPPGQRLLLGSRLHGGNEVAAHP